ncbi:MAG TPA: tetratricopeptide repeat protein [Methylomirabilota bacterium]|jgi:tetratricopeptide (TPR) repeat protein
MRPILLLAASLLLASCQPAPVPSAPVAAALAPAERLRAEGDVLLAAGRYAEAIEKYQEATDLDATAIGPRFGLGTAYSFLDRRPEAIAQFRWVLDRADPSSTEYQEASHWLLRVGALTAPATVAATSASEPARAADPALGHLVGKTQWPEVTPHRHLITGSLTLTGDEPVTQDVNRTRAFRLGDVYEFKDVPPGRYRVVAAIDGTTVWDEKVAVEAGKDTTLDLLQAASPVPAARYAPRT